MKVVKEIQSFLIRSSLKEINVLYNTIRLPMYCSCLRICYEQIFIKCSWISLKYMRLSLSSSSNAELIIMDFWLSSWTNFCIFLAMEFSWVNFCLFISSLLKRSTKRNSKNSVYSLKEICSKNGVIFFSFCAIVIKDSVVCSCCFCFYLDWLVFFLFFFVAIIKYYYIIYIF